jgi:hypothetical protein
MNLRAKVPIAVGPILRSVSFPVRCKIAGGYYAVRTGQSFRHSESNEPQQRIFRKHVD